MREFDQGVADIEREKVLKKQRSFVSPGIVSEKKAPEASSRDWMMDEFDAGVKEIEQSRAKEKPNFVSGVDKTLKTVPSITNPFPLVEEKKAELGVSPSKRFSPLRAAKRGLTHGKIGLAESVGTGLEYAGVRTGVNLLKKIGKETRAYWKEKAKPFEAPPEIQGSILNDPGIMLKGNWWAYNLADMIPSFASMMVPGVAAGKYLKIAGKVLELTPKVIERLVKFGSMTAAGITAGGMEGTSTYQEILDRGGTEQDAAAGMEAMTLASGALNSIGFGKITGKLGTQKSNAIINFLKNGSWEGLTEYLEEPAEVLIKMGLLPESAFTKKEAIEQLKEGVNVIPIAGIMGGGTSTIFAESNDKTEKIKRIVFDGITKTYEDGTQDIDQTTGSIIRGYKNRLFDDKDLDELSKKYPELKDGIKNGKEIVRAELVKEQLSSAIDKGLTTGQLNGEEFTLDNAMGFIRSGLKNNIFTDEDIDEFKEKYPDLKHGLNALIAEKVTADIDSKFVKFEPEPVVKTEKPADEYAIKDIEDTYLKAKERVRKEPVSLREIQERFKERQGREATEKEQNELNRIYEKAKRRSQQKKTFEEKRKAEEAPSKAREELELEAYEPELPPGVTEVRTKEGQRTYPRGAQYVAGKAAPEDLKIEYKPIQRKEGKKIFPWLTLNGAHNALESDKMKAAGVSPSTHKIVKTKGGYQIVPIKAGGQAMARKAKEEVKGKTLLSWVRAMGGIGDKTLPGEVRALSGKETGVVGLTNAKGLSFDEMAAEAVEEGWIEKPEDFSEKLRDDIFAQKEGKQRVERLADIAARTEREERWKEFDRAEDDMLEYFAKHPDEEILSDLNEWQKKSIADIRRRDEKRAKEIEEDIKREVEAENPDLERFKKDEGFSKFVEGWDEKDVLDEETLAELEAWRAEQKAKPEAPEVKPEAPEVKQEEESIVDIVDSAFNERARTNILVKEGIKAVPGIRLQDAEEAGRMTYLVAKGEATQKEFDEWIKRAETENRIRKTKQEALEPKDPVSSLLSSKKKAGVKYEMKIMITETGETVTVTKDAGVALREIKEELDKMNKFLECLI